MKKISRSTRKRRIRNISGDRMEKIVGDRNTVITYGYF
jgi:hypothetical protein